MKLTPQSLASAVHEPDAALAQSCSEEQLRRECLGFRNGILGRRSSYRMCDAVCWPLQAWLSFALKVQTDLRHGDMPMNGGNDGTMEHWWLELPDGRIIDPTADQLQMFGHPKMPKVFIGPKPDFYP